MRIKRKFLTKLFDEKIEEIESGWLYLMINNKEICIKVSGAFNSEPFHELLRMLKDINKDYTGIGRSREFGDFRFASNYIFHSLYFDEEGDGTQIFFSYNYDKDQQQIINIDVISDASRAEPNVFLYSIQRKDLFMNIFNVIEQNLETYNLECKKMWTQNCNIENAITVKTDKEFNAIIQKRGKTLEENPNAFCNTEEPIEGEGEYSYFKPLDRKKYFKIKKTILKKLNEK